MRTIAVRNLMKLNMRIIAVRKLMKKEVKNGVLPRFGSRDAVKLYDLIYKFPSHGIKILFRNDGNTDELAKQFLITCLPVCR